MNKDIPRIVTDILKNGASLAIVSRNTSKALSVYLITSCTSRYLTLICCYRSDRALYYFKAEDPKSGEMTSIIKMVRYDEVVDGESESLCVNKIMSWTHLLEPETEHFKRIQGWSKYDYNDMVSLSPSLQNGLLRTFCSALVRRQASRRQS